MRQGRSFLRALRRAGGVHTLGVFAVFGQLVMMRGSQTGLPKQNDGAQEGKCMCESISEMGLLDGLPAHESTVKISTAIPMPEEILALDEAMSIRTGRARRHGRQLLQHPGPCSSVQSLRRVPNPPPSECTRRSWRAREGRRAHGRRREPRDHTPHAGIKPPRPLARIGYSSCAAWYVTTVSTIRTALSGHGTRIAGALVRGAHEQIRRRLPICSRFSGTACAKRATVFR